MSVATSMTSALMPSAASFSAVTFSKSGQFAVYADEISGTIGWIDLQSRYLREGASQVTCRSPEGIAVLADGRLAITEESGRLVVLDPQRDDALVVGKRGIERGSVHGSLLEGPDFIRCHVAPA